MKHHSVSVCLQRLLFLYAGFLVGVTVAVFSSGDPMSMQTYLLLVVPSSATVWVGTHLSRQRVATSQKKEESE